MHNPIPDRFTMIENREARAPVVEGFATGSIAAGPGQGCELLASLPEHRSVRFSPPSLEVCSDPVKCLGKVLIPAVTLGQHHVEAAAGEI